MTHSMPGYDQLGVAMTCRSYAEYERMFAFAEVPLLEGEVLDIAAGASSFAAQAGQRGRIVYAADPLYAMTPEQIAAFGRSEIEASTRKLEAIQHIYDWSYYGDIQRHQALRLQSLDVFAADYSRRLDDGDAQQGGAKYTAARLPELPYGDGQFAEVLCSHFLFLYHDQFDYDFHLRSLLEMARVARPGGRIRIYPLLSLRWEPYPLLARLLTQLADRGLEARTLKSDLPFIPGSTELLLVRKPG